ncbi:MAG: hypothetical protein WCL70_02690 [Paludibacter sp.]
MARVKQFDVITGSIANLSFYTRKGSTEVFARTKGGASKEKIKRNPEFANVRKNNKEFGGCSKISKQIRLSFYPVRNVADYNLAPALNSVVKNIQKMDEESPWGERSIRLSKYRSILTGFDFNRTNRFSSMVRIPLHWEINRENQQAEIVIPAFACSYGLYLPWKYTSFRLVATLGIVSDFVLNQANQTYEPTHGDFTRPQKYTETPWFSTQASIPEQKLSLTLADPAEAFNDDDTLVLAIAIEFGTQDAFGNQIPQKGAGAGMVLGVG